MLFSVPRQKTRPSNNVRGGEKLNANTSNFWIWSDKFTCLDQNQSLSVHHVFVAVPCIYFHFAYQKDNAVDNSEPTEPHEDSEGDTDTDIQHLEEEEDTKVNVVVVVVVPPTAS